MTMIELANVPLPLDAGLPDAAAADIVLAAAARALGVSEGDVETVRVVKRSVDARKKSNVHFVATLAVSLRPESEEDRLLERGRSQMRGVSVRRFAPPRALLVPEVGSLVRERNEPRPLVVGAGPAGLFCALYLAEAGMRPILVERGGNVDERRAAVAAFEAGGPLDPQTNVQFGEGGAGTFSDGKLNTGTKSPHIRHVLEAFVRAGAPEEILWQAKPHIGTDLLPDVVKSLRERIVAHGGEVRFRAQLVGLHFDGGALVAADVRRSSVERGEFGSADVFPGEFAGGGESSGFEGGCQEGSLCRIATNRVVLACGHSARDTFELVREAGLAMERKPFSVGVRIEHLQSQINRTQYGFAAEHPALGAADYRLAIHLPDGRGVYTFCMCPGGTVVAAASEEGGVCTNGMSRFARDGENANSALLVEVRPGDLRGDDVLAGVELQRSMEHAAYCIVQEAGGAPYTAPAQTVGDFLAIASGKADASEGAPAAPAASCSFVAAESAAMVRPTYPRGVTWCDLHECLPRFVSSALACALPLLDAKLHGFADPNAIMTGVETRSSSPVRILRNEDFQARWSSGSFSTSSGSSSAPSDLSSSGGNGVYPCGEGAGYAGGIMSAAVDGIRVAEAIVREIAEDAGDSVEMEIAAPETLYRECVPLNR